MHLSTQNVCEAVYIHNHFQTPQKCCVNDGENHHQVSCTDMPRITFGELHEALSVTKPRAVGHFVSHSYHAVTGRVTLRRHENIKYYVTGIHPSTMSVTISSPNSAATIACSQICVILTLKNTSSTHESGSCTLW